MLRSILSVLALLSAPVSAGATDLSQREIADELVGRTITWWEQEGWRHGYLMLLPNGAAEMTVDRPGRHHDLGRWSLRGDEVCTRWGEVRDGMEKCYRVSRGERGLFVTTGGNVFEVRDLGV